MTQAQSKRVVEKLIVTGSPYETVEGFFHDVMFHESTTIDWEKIVKRVVSQYIPRNAEGDFFRSVIFHKSTSLDWEVVEKLLLKHFPELKNFVYKERGIKL